MPIPFLHPSTILLAGPTMCGKTHFLVQFLSEHMLSPFPQRIVLVYSEKQPAYSEIMHQFPCLELLQGPINSELYESFRAELRNLLILDDQMTTAANSTELTKFFVQGAHHRNLTIMFLVQNIFAIGKSMRTSSLNTNYLVLFKNPRDKLQPSTLARQIFPGKWKNFIQAFEYATREPYTYIVIDLRQDTPEEFRVRSKIFGTDGVDGTDVYIF